MARTGTAWAHGLRASARAHADEAPRTGAWAQATREGRSLAGEACALAPGQAAYLRDEAGSGLLDRPRLRAGDVVGAHVVGGPTVLSRCAACQRVSAPGVVGREAGRNVGGSDEGRSGLTPEHEVAAERSWAWI